jgi:hypothetical protein
MGKWLNQLREIAKTPEDRADKTDKTAPAKVLSVLSACSDGVSKILAPDRAVLSVSLVGSPSDPFLDFRAFNNHGWDEEDWQTAFEERAAILEFDEGLSRQEAESLACRQIETVRKRRIQ